MDAKTEIQNFITTVKSHREIWDKTSRDHHNRFALEKTWLAIARETNITIKEAQTKWKSLRDYYRKELKRLVEVYGADVDEETTSETSWPYFKNLYFLKNQFNIKKPETPSSSDPLSIQKNTESPLDFATTVKIENLDDDSMERSDSDSLYFLTGDPSQGSFTHPPAPGKKRKLSRNENADVTRQATAASSKSSDGFDEDRHFFESLLPHSKRIRGIDKMLFRSEVHKLIIKYAYSGKRANCNTEASPSDCETVE